MVFEGVSVRPETQEKITTARQEQGAHVGQLQETLRKARTVFEGIVQATITK